MPGSSQQNWRYDRSYSSIRQKLLREKIHLEFSHPSLSLAEPLFHRLSKYTVSAGLMPSGTCKGGWRETCQDVLVESQGTQFKARSKSGMIKEEESFPHVNGERGVWSQEKSWMRKEKKDVCTDSCYTHKREVRRAWQIPAGWWGGEGTIPRLIAVQLAQINGVFYSHDISDSICLMY